MNRALTQEEHLFIRLWNEGASYEDIGTEIGIARATMHDWRVRLGLSARHVSQQRKYSPQDMETIRRLWCDEGLSASEIARRMGGDWNRNIVIGKITRRGWAKAGRGKPSAPTRKPSRAAATPKSPAAAPIDLTKSRSDSTPQQRAEKSAQGQAIIARVERSEVKSPNATPFLQATRGCKWPIGSGLALHYCCNPVVGGVGAAKVYCEGHHEMAVSSIQPYRSRSPVSSFTRHDRIATPKAKPANDPFGSIWDDGRAVA